MDSNMTFRIDSEVKAQMAAICDALCMSTSTAFNIFANAFVRAKGMPFARTKALAKILKAVEVDMHSASQMAAICAFTSESMRKVMLESMFKPPLHYNNTT